MLPNGNRRAICDVKTDRCDVATPGSTEIDLVAHCGSLGDGEFVHSLF